MNSTHCSRHRGGILKKLLATIAILVVLVLSVVGYEFYLGATATPTIATNYTEQIHDQTLERHRARSGPGLNQYPAYESVMIEVVAANDWLRQESANLPDDPDNPWVYIDLSTIYYVPDEGTPEQHAEAVRLATDALAEWERRGIFEGAAEISELERVARPPTEEPMANFPMGYLGTSRALSRALAARARLAAQRGDHDQRLLAIEHMLALGRHAADLGYLIDLLVGAAIQSVGRTALLENQLLYPVGDDQWLQRADAIVQRELVELAPSLGIALDNERLYVADMLQRCYTDNGRGNGRFIPLLFAEIIGEDPEGAATSLTPFGDTKLSNIHGRLFLDRKQANEWLDGAWDLHRAAAVAKGMDALEADRRAAEYYQSADWRNPLAMNLATFGRVGTADRTRHVQAAGTRVLLAIERYRLANGGDAPQSLDDLGDLLPGSLRTDPFTGQPWDYSPTPLTVDPYGDPLLPGHHAWPYTLRSRGLPGEEAEYTYENSHHAHYGVLITVPIDGPQYDEPEIDPQSEGS